MNEEKKLAGALSNDLFRVVSLVSRNAYAAAARFLIEAKTTAGKLEKSKNTKTYIKNIAKDILSSDVQLDTEKTEKFLMYAVLTQNYSLKLTKNTKQD